MCVVQVQTYPPAYFPPLSSSWPRAACVLFLLIPPPAKSTQVVRRMLAGVGSDLSSPKPGRVSALKRTPSRKLANVALVSPTVSGCRRARAPLLDCPRMPHHFCVHRLVTRSPGPACGCKAASLRAGLVQSSLRASEGELSPFKPPRYSGEKCRSGAGFSPAQ